LSTRRSDYTITAFRRDGAFAGEGGVMGIEVVILAAAATVMPVPVP
jgi:hypothetical protein